jgi:type IV pilus assembly protein PilX
MQPTPRNIRQNGAILVVSLLLLLVLTMLGLTAMQMTRMEERMSGNTRDRDIAFQGAEAGLREGEAQLETLTEEPIPCIAAPCFVWERQANEMIGELRDKDQTWWATNSQEFGADGEGDMHTAEQPRFVVQEVRRIENDLNVGQSDDGSGRSVYRVVSTSVGATSDARVMLETTFTRLSN